MDFRNQGRIINRWLSTTFILLEDKNMTTKTITSGKETGRTATLEGDTIHISKGSHRLSTEKIKRYKTAATAQRQFDLMTTTRTPVPDTAITLKISDIKREIDNIGDSKDEYQRGRKSILLALLWHNDTKE